LEEKETEPHEDVYEQKIEKEDEDYVEIFESDGDKYIGKGWNDVDYE
jgi:hypothetical protein